MLNFNRIQIIALSIIFVLSFTDGAFAAAQIDTVSQNITNSASRLPGLLTAVAYLLGTLFGVVGVLKLKDHVINPTQVPLKASLIRFFAGGALFALPIVFEAAYISITGNVPMAVTYNTNGIVSSALGNITNIIAGGGATTAGFNQILGNIFASIDNTPGLITAAAYLLGVLSCVSGILKIKDHVETPEQIQLKEGVIRLLLGGALFALPVIYAAADMTIMGGSPFAVSSISPTAGGFGTSAAVSGFAASCTAAGSAATATFGNTVCMFIDMTGTTPAFLTSLSYLFGLVMGVWALLKIRDHVLNPTQTQIWEGISRLIACGAFFTMPYVAAVMNDTVTTGSVFTIATGYYGGATVTCTAGPMALDLTMACFMQDIMAPTHILANHFSLIAGVVFIMIGISRLMKSAQDGPRGPGGMGTLATFIVAGVLLSYNTIIGAFSASLTGTSAITTNGNLNYVTGMSAAEQAHVEIVIGAVIQFLIIVGIISFIRGWFIVRQVAEGNSQASLMAGATHIIGGALAVNLGPILTAIQNSIGITSVGIAFS